MNLKKNDEKLKKMMKQIKENDQFKEKDEKTKEK